MLEALTVILDGSPAAPDYFSRRRRVLHKALGYAVHKKRLDKNPVSKGKEHSGPPCRSRPLGSRMGRGTCQTVASAVT